MAASPTDLHTAARRYLIEREAHWVQIYSEMRRSARGDYSPRDLDTFPRYSVLRAILEEVERQKPENLIDLETARTQLSAMGQSAASPFTELPAEWDIARRAMLEERNAFSHFVRVVPDAALVHVEPLPYRRVLAAEELEALRADLARLWDVPRDGCWYPLQEGTRPDLLAVNSETFDRQVGGAGLVRLLQSHNVRRTWELREHGPSYEADLAILDPQYTGAEGYWSSAALDWIVYASHEGSITLGGAWLVEAVKSEWPDWGAHLFS